MKFRGTLAQRLKVLSTNCCMVFRGSRVFESFIKTKEAMAFQLLFDLDFEKA